MTTIRELLINYPEDAYERVVILEEPVVCGDEAHGECIVVVKVPVDSVTITISLDQQPDDVTPEMVGRELNDLRED